MRTPTSRQRRLVVALTAAAALGIVPAAQAAAGAQPDRPRHDRAADRAAAHRHAEKQVTPAEQRRALAAARRGADSQSRRLGLDRREELVVQDVILDADGTTHTRYTRTLDGMPVIAGDLVVHQKPSGRVYATDRAHRGSVVPGSTTPTVSRSTSLAKADRRTAYDIDERAATLSVYAAGKHPRLAWDTVVEGVRADQTPSRRHVVLDAHTGKVLTSWEEIHTADNGTGHSIYSGTVALGTTPVSGGYRMEDGSRGGGYTIDMANRQSGGSILTDADNVWGNGSQGDPASAAVDAHWGAAMTWDYYLQRHDRNGIFDTGQGVPSRVHYGNGYSNAFWDGSQMTYGDGTNNANPLVELDVAGHEMSHGVTEHTAGLVYSGDAGGLNEATSDIFGTGVEWHANNSSDVPDYLIGEELDLRGNGTPLRRMDDPEALGSQYINCWSPGVAGQNPHYSSGPANHWYYLASEGSGAKTVNGVQYDSPTCDGSSVTGMGHEKAEDVWYRALSTYMTSTETYPQARDDVIQSAIDLYGADGPECTTTEAAFDAIDVPAGSVSCDGGSGPGPDPSSCDSMPNGFTGSLGYGGDYAYEPDEDGFSGYYYSGSAGVHTGCLDGPAGTDYDLYLQKWNGSTWVTVAQSTTAVSHEEISYSGTAGNYSYVVQSYTGSGSYTLGIDAP